MLSSHREADIESWGCLKAVRMSMMKEVDEAVEGNDLGSWS